MLDDNEYKFVETKFAHHATDKKLVEGMFKGTNKPSIKVFYVPLGDDKNGFEFYVANWIRYFIEDDPHIWTDKAESLVIECICNGYAYWDGIRHIYWSPGEDGYYNYPDMTSYIEVCKTLMELEKEFCTESEWFDDNSEIT